MDRERRILDRHFRRWRDQGLISPELEVRLRSASSEVAGARASGTVRTALAVLGGGLLLAGLTLLIAENWEAIPRGAKLAGWAGLLCGFLALAVALGRRWPDRPYLAEALSFVAGGWVLAGIALVSQIYQLDSRPANGIWFWLVLLLPAAWILEQRSAAVLVFGALVAALTLEVDSRDSWLRAGAGENPWLWLGLPLLCAAACSWLPRPAAWLRSWITGWVFAAGTVFLLVFGRFHWLATTGLGGAWAVAGTGLALAVLAPGRVFSRAWDATTSRAVLACVLLPWIVVGSRYDSDVLLDHAAVGLAWMTQLAMAVLVIRAGARGESETWVNLGYMALLAGVVVRYFDFFGDYLQGGGALALTGILLLFILYALENARRRTLKGASS